MNVGKECKVIVECPVAYDNESLAGFLRFFLMGKIQDANDKMQTNSKSHRRSIQTILLELEIGSSLEELAACILDLSSVEE